MAYKLSLYLSYLQEARELAPLHLGLFAALDVGLYLSLKEGFNFLLANPPLDQLPHRSPNAIIIHVQATGGMKEGESSLRPKETPRLN